MTKITIEVDGPVVSQAAPQGAPAESAAPAGGQPQTGGEYESLATLLQRAAASGAINAGPAPSAQGVAAGVPIASSVAGGSHAIANSAATSAGPAPEHLFGSTGGKGQ